jgi:hypothetical protein
MPRWVKVSGVVVLVLGLVLFSVREFTSVGGIGAGMLGPGMHMPRQRP